MLLKYPRTPPVRIRAGVNIFNSAGIRIRWGSGKISQLIILPLVIAPIINVIVGWVRAFELSWALEVVLLFGLCVIEK